MFRRSMVCDRLTLERDGVNITELAPVCLEGRVIYAASFDPAFERPRVVAVPSPAPAPSTARPSNPSDTRLFFVGIAAGVIAAMALGNANSH